MQLIAAIIMDELYIIGVKLAADHIEETIGEIKKKNNNNKHFCNAILSFLMNLNNFFKKSNLFLKHI